MPPQCQVSYSGCACPANLPLTSSPRKKRPTRMFPERVNLVLEAHGSRRNKGWTVVDAGASCPHPTAGQGHSLLRSVGEASLDIALSREQLPYTPHPGGCLVSARAQKLAPLPALGHLRRSSRYPELWWRRLQLTPPIFLCPTLLPSALPHPSRRVALKSIPNKPLPTAHGTSVPLPGAGSTHTSIRSGAHAPPSPS